jgi:hypothetical protein
LKYRLKHISSKHSASSSDGLNNLINLWDKYLESLRYTSPVGTNVYDSAIRPGNAHVPEPPPKESSRRKNRVDQ